MYITICDGLFKDKTKMRLIICTLKWLPKRILLNVVTYTILSDALCKRGKLKEVKNGLVVLLKACVKLNIFTFNTLMNGY